MIIFCLNSNASKYLIIYSLNNIWQFFEHFYYFIEKQKTIYIFDEFICSR